MSRYLIEQRCLELVSPSKASPPAPTAAASTTKSTTTTTKRTTTAAPKNDAKNDGFVGCRGTCVSGFFTLLCDEIDRSVSCPGNGRCCLTKKVEEGGSGNSGGGSPPRQTSRPPPTKNHPPPASQKQQQQQRQPCPGICLPQMMSNLCTPPSVLVQVLWTCLRLL